MIPKSKQNYINHVVLALDASSSMYNHRNELIKVADGQIAYLAQRSRELDQETRVTVYTFSNKVECVVYDKDVLRLPSIREYYSPSGITALVDATRLSIDDLMMTPQKYGDHAFLIFVLTDGIENASKFRDGLDVKIQSLPDNWTVASLVPDQRGKYEAKKFGFPADNIAIWDANSAQGVQEVGETIRRATDDFMQARAQGVRGTRSMFSTGAEAVNDQTIQQAGLIPIPPHSYMLIPVTYDSPIREFVQHNGLTFVLGNGYYQLSKRETIQPQKNIVVVERGTDRNSYGKIYGGREARHLIGLPDDVSVQVTPNYNPDYHIFVQSTALNRKLIAGTHVLVML